MNWTLFSPEGNIVDIGQDNGEVAVPVKHPNGDLLIAKTLRMLKRVEDGK